MSAGDQRRMLVDPAAASVLAFLLFAASVDAGAQTVAPPATAPGRPTPPTRPADGPGAPHWTLMGADMNAPADRSGNFEIGPDYRLAPEAAAVEGRPRGKVYQFVMDSKDSKRHPGIARDAFGTVDPNNPKTLIVKTYAEPWQRAITGIDYFWPALAAVAQGPAPA